MNATGHIESKWRPKGVTLTLHGTRCVLISMNLRKNEIHLLYLRFVFTSFLFIICGFFYLNLANKRRRKVIIRRVWLLRSLRLDVDRMLCRPINYCIYLWRRLRVTSCERVSFMEHEPRRSKIRSSKEIVGECKYWIMENAWFAMHPRTTFISSTNDLGGCWGMFAVCRRLLINRFCLIVWLLVLLKKLVAEMYMYRALYNLGMHVFLSL